MRTLGLIPIFFVLLMLIPSNAYGSHYFNIGGKPLKWNHTDFTFYTPKNLELITDALETIEWRTNNTFTFTRVDRASIADITYEWNGTPMKLPNPAYGFTNYLSNNRTIQHTDITLDIRLKQAGIYYVALHESLHALGLNHSLEKGSIMSVPYQRGNVITDTDVEHLLLLYLQPKMPIQIDCEKIDWLLCWYVEGRINDGYHTKADVNMLEYNAVNGCAKWWVTIPTHNIEDYDVLVVFWNEDVVVAMARYNITYSQEVSFCTSAKTDDAQLGYT